MDKDRALLTFSGVGRGDDVYNTSVSFAYAEDPYLFGRVERRDEWANAHVRLFRRTGQGAYTLVPDSMIYPLEASCIAKPGDAYVLCGTHVQKLRDKVRTYHAYFYRGSTPFALRHCTTGPRQMKDIRLVSLASGRIGVFSRPR